LSEILIDENETRNAAASSLDAHEQDAAASSRDARRQDTAVPDHARETAIAKGEELALSIRRDVLTMTHNKKAGFIGSAFSCADILAMVYSTYIMKKHDLFILSKGHAASAWYAALAHTGAAHTVKGKGVTKRPPAESGRV
jgi:hypothetical protein